MAEIDLIGVPFDGYGRVGNQARAAEALRDAGLLDAFDHHPVVRHDHLELLAMTELLGWWLHIDLDVLDPLEFAARGLPDVEDEPGGLTWTSSPTWCAMLDSGSCICASIAIYDPDQHDDGTGAGQIVTFVRTIVGSYREGR